MHGIQTSETMELGALMALCGGFMDAYSYICRGEVFANAQTGNIVLLGINLSEGNFSGALTYLIPILAFIAGIILTIALRGALDKRTRKIWSAFHWRQFVVLIEILCLIGVCFIPHTLNLAANSIISLVCAMQVESFRKIRGNIIATTMCTGNLRSGTQSLFKFFSEKDSAHLKKSLFYYSVIGCFIAGAFFGNLFIKMMGDKALFICAAILFIAFLMMFINEKTTKNPTLQNKV